MGRTRKKPTTADAPSIDQQPDGEDEKRQGAVSDGSNSGPLANVSVKSHGYSKGVLSPVEMVYPVVLRN